MKLENTLLNIDYLIYSSHKTATQTITHTLNSNNFVCVHCHSITDETTNLELGTFTHFLQQYYKKNKRKLKIITCFREPIERYISSFFQWNGDGVVRKKIVQNINETIIYKNSIKELREKLIQTLNSQRHVGKLESIEQICSELNINLDDMNYNKEKQYGLVELDYCVLYVFRFDILIYKNRLEYLLSQVTGKTIVQQNANLSSSKWYYNTFTEFKASLKIPHRTITEIYESKRNILNLLYPSEYNTLLTMAHKKYG